MYYVFTGDSANEFPRDCVDLYLEHGLRDGSDAFSIYLPKTNKRKRVLCDMKTDGGGWTVCSLRFADMFRFKKVYRVRQKVNP